MSDVRQGMVEPRAQPPSITALAPNDDTMLGGATVNITGFRLTGATSVMFGTVPAPDFLVQSDTAMTATAPPQQNAGFVDVTVTTPNGTSGGLQFNYHVPPNPITAEEIVFEAGESLSQGINTGTGQIYAILVPQDWSPTANLTFQISADGTNYCDVFDSRGNEAMMPALPGTAIIPDAANVAWLQAVGWIRLRSGSRKAPVPQEEIRTFTVFTK
jgi:hypothetical protein